MWLADDEDVSCVWQERPNVLIAANLFMAVARNGTNSVCIELGFRQNLIEKSSRTLSSVDDFDMGRGGGDSAHRMTVIVCGKNSRDSQ